MKCGPVPRSAEERYLEKIDKNGPNGCWIWTAGEDGKGYGRFWVNGATRYAHRVIYELLIGQIPRGVLLDHICHNRICVNPEHIRLCNSRENCRNRAITKRNTSGFKGVRWDKQTGKWRAVIGAGRKYFNLGCFLTPEAAHEAYCEAAIRLHGEFANFGAAAGIEVKP